MEIALKEGARIMQVEHLMAKLKFHHPANPQHEWVFLHRIPGKAIINATTWKPLRRKGTTRL